MDSLSGQFEWTIPDRLTGGLSTTSDTLLKQPVFLHGCTAWPGTGPLPNPGLGTERRPVSPLRAGRTLQGTSSLGGRRESVPHSVCVRDRALVADAV